MNNQIKFRLNEPILHKAGTKLSVTQLQEIKAKMSQCTFNRDDYPDLHVAVSGQPHYRQLLDENNQVIGEWFKFMYLDQSDIGKFNDPEILRLHQNLAEHVRGQFDYASQKWESGFQKFDHHMTGNRDGPNTAYTTGIALQGSYAAAPAVHSTWEKTKDSEYMQWLAKFHCILGDLGGRVMSTVMDDVYNQFTKERHERYNPPFFGPSTGSQTYFTSSQINRSTNTMRLQGTAAGVHCDSTDDELSFSLALNVSVIKDSTSLGYFWFPDFDTLIPVKPMSMIIFQGIEEHTGMPMVLDNNDSSSLPCGYTEDTRFNIICYPKGPTMKNTTYRNYGSFVNSAPERPNLMADALPSFGGKENYDTWRAREILRVNIPNIKNIFGRHIAINIDAEAQYNSISFPDNDSQYTLTPYSVSPNNSVELENLTPPESQAVIAKQLTPYQTININDIFDNTLFDTFIDKLRQKINFVRHTPFKSSITESNSNAITSLITNSNIENPIYESLIDIAEDENDIDDISDIQTFEYNSEKNQNLFDHIGVDNDNDNEPLVRTIDDINSFQLFELGVIENHIATLKGTSLMTKNQHTFSMREELKDQIPFLPPVDQTEIQNVSRFIPDFSTTYSRILGTLSKKSSQLDPLKGGLLAAQGKLAFEHMEMLEHDFFDLFNPTSNIILPPNSIAYRLRKKIDELVDPLNGSNEPGLKLFFSAEEILGDKHHSGWHLDVNLEPDTRHTSSPALKAKAFRNVLWGMTVFYPVHAFIGSFKRTRLSDITDVTLPLVTNRHYHYRHIFGRVEFLQRICNALSQIGIFSFHILNINFILNVNR